MTHAKSKPLANPSLFIYLFNLNHPLAPGAPRSCPQDMGKYCRNYLTIMVDRGTCLTVCTLMAPLIDSTNCKASSQHSVDGGLPGRGDILSRKIALDRLNAAGS